MSGKINWTLVFGGPRKNISVYAPKQPGLNFHKIGKITLAHKFNKNKKNKNKKRNNKK